MGNRVHAVTKEMYWCAKTLLNGGATNKEVMDYFKLSDETVRRIKKSENYEDFRQYTYNYKKNFAIKKAAEEAAAKKAAEEAKKAEAAKIAEEVGAVPAAQIIQLPSQPQKPISMTIQATHYMETKLDKVIELLTGISAKLAFIVTDLYGDGEKVDAK